MYIHMHMFSLVHSLYNMWYQCLHTLTYLPSQFLHQASRCIEIPREDTKGIVDIEDSTEVLRDYSNHFSLLVGQSIVCI